MGSGIEYTCSLDACLRPRNKSVVFLSTEIRATEFGDARVSDLLLVRDCSPRYESCIAGIEISWRRARVGVSGGAVSGIGPTLNSGGEAPRNGLGRHASHRAGKCATPVFALVRAHPRGERLLTFIESQPDGQIRFTNQNRLTDAWLARRGEPFRWGIKRDALPEFLRGVGLETREIDTPEFYRPQYLRPLGQDHAPLPEGDYLCHAATAPPK